MVLTYLKINEIQDFSQQVAEAISSVLHVDITIVDGDMTRIAGTGIYYSDINTTLPRSYAFHRVLHSGKKCFIPNPGNSETCKNCIEKDFCKEKATMLVPVIVDGKVVAAIGLLALTDEHMDDVINQYENFSNFMEKMADLLAAKIKSEMVAKEAQLLAKNLHTITEAYPDGILSINAQGEVTHFNRPAEILLNIKAESILNRHYQEKIICPSIEETLKTGVAMDALHSTFTIDHRQIPIILTTQPIKHHHSIEGVVCFFQGLDKTKKVLESFTQAHTRYTFNHIKGQSPSIGQVIELAKKVAPSHSTILLTGESGTGKELFAKAIHSSSKRSHGPFIAINCSAIPDTLLESELFGYAKGSFSGAKKEGKPGKFELAHNGTIFLDEIGDMSIHLQSKLLRVLQDKIVERVGDTKSVAVDVRIIAATNRNLEELIQKNLFREDLYYRINVIPIHLPPLRHRKEDILLLAEHFLKKYDTLLLKGILGFHPDTIQHLIGHPWPGNIRELENAIEYAVNIETTAYIQPHSLPLSIRQSQTSSVSDHTVFVPPISTSLKSALVDSEKTQIIKALSIYGTSTLGKKQVAKALGISLSTLYRKLKELEIK